MDSEESLNHVSSKVPGNAYARYLALVLISVVLSGWLVTSQVLEDLKGLHEAEDLLPVAELIILSGDAVNCLQTERGAATGLLTDRNNEYFQNRVQSARADTDRALRKLITQLETPSGHRFFDEWFLWIDDFRSQRQKLDRHRSAVDQAATGVDENLSIYTTIIASLIDLIGRIQVDAPREAHVARTTKIYHVVQATESAGLQRALGAQLLNAGFSDRRVRQFNRQVDLHQRAIDELSTHLDTDHRAQLRALLNAESTRHLARQRDLLSEGIHTSESEPLTSDTWFDNATVYIDQLHELQAVMAERLIDSYLNYISDTRESVWIRLALYGFMGVLLISLAHLDAKRIRRMLTAVCAALSRMTPGSADQVIIEEQVPVDELDRLGAAVTAFQENAVVKRELAKEVAHLKRLLDSAEVALQVLDHDSGQILDVNGHWSTLFGWSAEEARGLSVLELHRETEAGEKFFRAQLLEGTESHLRTLLHRENGELLELEIFVSREQDAGERRRRVFVFYREVAPPAQT